MAGPAPRTSASRSQRTVTATIALGTSTVTTPVLGIGNLAGVGVTCSARQGAPDATCTALAAQGNSDGTVTVTGNQAATAALVVAITVTPP